MIKGVVAKNVYRLRKVAGLNQNDLAKLSGISRPAYVAIEKGQTDPRSETIHRIANALHVPISELFAHIPELKSVRFRMSKITGQKKKIREQEIIKIARWLRNYNFLEELLGEEKEYMLSDIRSKDPQRAAEKVRQKLGIEGDEPIADITEVINDAGIKLHYNNLSIDNFFGLSIGREEGGPAISVNVAENISIERQIFTAAHEMGHLILHKESFNGELLEDDESEEREANIFASYFLMPEKAFKEEVARNRGLHWVDMVLTVKRFFKVSYRTVLMRLIDDGMADRNIYMNFAITMKSMYDISLKGHFEPDALTSYNEASAMQEPEGNRKTEMKSNRLFTLVRKAVERELITLSRAAEILELSLEDMRDLANSWKVINWDGLKI
ncbi:MAG: helix-turn-helix domain-containing protein [Spirochaetota bacterium]